MGAALEIGNAVEEARRLVSWWVVWLPSLYPLFTYLMGFVGAWIATRVALVPMKRATSGHWTERTRHAYPGMMSGGRILILLPPALGALAAASTGALSIGPPLAVGICAGVSAFLGAYVAVWRLSRRLRGSPLTLRRSLAEYGTWMSVQLLPLLLLMTLAGLAAPKTWLGCAAVGAVICLAGVLLHRGVGLTPGRWAGLVHPPEPRLLRLVEAAAHDSNMRMPIVEQADLQMANAFALPAAGRLLFTTSLLRLLSDEQVVAVARHELAHLAEPARVRAARFAPIVALAFLVFAPAFVARGEWPLALLFLVGPVSIIMAVAALARRLETEADHHATHGAPSPVYARALEILYEANLFPAVHGRKTHPDLYSRMVEAGMTPSFPKPSPPSEWRGFASLLLGFAVALSPYLAFKATQFASDEVCAAIGSPTCLARLGQSYVDEGRREGAAALYRAASALDPLNATLAGRLASLDAELGECETAQSDLSELGRRPKPEFEHADSWLEWIQYEVANCFALRRGETLPFPQHAEDEDAIEAAPSPKASP